MGTSDDHIARLESEIRYLKGLLDENGIAYDYEAFVEVSKREEPVEIDFLSLSMEKSKMLHQDFRKNAKIVDFSRKSCIFATELLKT